MTLNWDEYFIQMAMTVSTKSKDPSTKVGCVLVGRANQVLATGFNGFPRGVWEIYADDVFKKVYETPANKLPTDLLPRWERPTKYDFVEHAERNAIHNAARHGVRLEGATAYLNWQPMPCNECAKAFIQAGIAQIIGPDIEFPNHQPTTRTSPWKTSVSEVMLAEARVRVRTVPWPKRL